MHAEEGILDATNLKDAFKVHLCDSACLHRYPLFFWRWTTLAHFARFVKDNPPRAIDRGAQTWLPQVRGSDRAKRT